MKLTLTLKLAAVVGFTACLTGWALAQTAAPQAAPAAPKGFGPEPGARANALEAARIPLDDDAPRSDGQ